MTGPQKKESVLYLCQPPPDRTSLLRSQVERKVFLVFVVIARSLALLLVGHGQHAGD